MTRVSTVHATFTIERAFQTDAARVFEAWSNADFKRAWFACHEDWQTVAYELDFRVGGRERNVVAPPAGPQHVFAATYLDIVPDHRIIYAYDMLLGQKRISVSLATVVFLPNGRDTKMIFTEQATFLDGYDGAVDRRHGTEQGFERLAGSFAPRITH